MQSNYDSENYILLNCAPQALFTYWREVVIYIKLYFSKLVRRIKRVPLNWKWRVPNFCKSLSTNSKHYTVQSPRMWATKLPWPFEGHRRVDRYSNILFSNMDTGYHYSRMSDVHWLKYINWYYLFLSLQQDLPMCAMILFGVSDWIYGQW